MLRIIHNAYEEVAPIKRGNSRREKALAWMQQQNKLERANALEKFADRIAALEKKETRHHI